MIQVLIVDDSSTARLLIEKMLELDPEIQVVGTAASGRKALEMVEKFKPDLITMDIKMPDMNGLEATKAYYGSPSDTYPDCCNPLGFAQTQCGL